MKKLRKIENNDDQVAELQELVNSQRKIIEKLEKSNQDLVKNVKRKL
jgi:hypothetical protein